jgi:Baseplate J-like protein
LIRPARPLLDSRLAAQIVAALQERRPGFVPEWRPGEKGPDAAILQVFARYLQAILQRLNQVPDKHKLAFLDLLGLDLIPAQAARVAMVFRLAEKAPDSRLPAGTRVAAPPPPERSEQIIFETERTTGLAAAKLTEVVSLWPGRDQYLDHSAAFIAGAPFQLFKKSQLQDTPHVLYLAHNTLLALAGKSNVDVKFELTTPSDEPLTIFWEYWEGQVWRGFLNSRPACLEEAARFDGTGGLTASGTVHLQADCAEAAKTTIHGIEAFWIRGRLTEPLPPESGKILPEVESIKLQTVIARPPECARTDQFGVTFDSLAPGTQYGASAGHVSGDVIFTENSIPVSVVAVPSFAGGETFNECHVEPATSQFGAGHLMSIENIGLKFDVAALGGVVDLVSFEFEDRGGAEFMAVNGEPIARTDFNTGVTEVAPGVKLSITITSPVNERPVTGVGVLTGPVETLILGGQEFALDNLLVQRTLHNGFLPDQAFAGANVLDVTKTFFPFGEQPRPGNAFYFSSEELFSKPKARAQLMIQSASTPEQRLNIQPGSNATSKKEPLAHTVVWEYWNGQKWAGLTLQPTLSPGYQPDFDDSDVFRFDVPEDMAPTKVNDQEARWVRARLQSGGYGFTAKVAWSDNQTQTPNEFTYVVPQAPALADFRLCYAWIYGPFHPEHVFAYNDFQFEDRTAEALWPGQTFQPFKPVRDATPALYLGFDRQLPVDRINVYCDIVEQRGETLGPTLLWQYWDGLTWEDLSVEDETRYLRVPGLVSFIAPEESQSLARFGTPRHWLRARLKEDGPPGEPTFHGIFPNAVWAVQRQTITDEALGASPGQSNQVFGFRLFPILGGDRGDWQERIEVRELNGPRAHVEWRALATEVLGEAPTVIAELEAQLAREGPQTEIEQGDLRLRRDRHKHVTEVWIRWHSRRHFFSSGPHDRHYVVERARGRLYFGDGDRGKIPPLGAAVLARQYRTGGGLVGNVAAGAITQILGGVAGIEAAFNPRPAEGGADTETLEALSLRGPQTLRHRGRALSAQDYETFARQTSPAVAFARAIPGRDPGGRHASGWVTLLIIPQSMEPRPWPSFGLREQVRKGIEAHAPADVAVAHQIYVTGPDYVAIDVEATLVPLDPAEAGVVEQRGREAIETFLHPLRGGPERRGWELGRDVFLSDVAAVLERVAGLDYVKELALFVNDGLQGERVRVPDDRIVIAGKIRLKLLAGEVGRAG